MDFLEDFNFDNGVDVDLSLVFGEEEDNLLSEICKEFADGDIDLDQFDDDKEDDSSIGRGGLVEACKYGIGKRLEDDSIGRGGLVEACKYGIGKRLEDILRPDKENHDIDDDDDDQVQPQQQHVEKPAAVELKSLNEEDEENHIDDNDDQVQPQHVVEKPAAVELKSSNEEGLERKLEASKKKLHARYQEADLKRSKRTVQVLDLKDCPDLKRSRKCVGGTTKRCWVQSSYSSSSSFSKKKSTSSCFRGGRMSSCK